MPLTGAERQQAWRQRRTRLVTALQARCAALEAERDQLRGDLDAALGEAQRLALTACRHPAGAVDGGTCRAWGQDMW
jgi:outer membrane murein-binding lipoprotein Lpp